MIKSLKWALGVALLYVLLSATLGHGALYLRSATLVYDDVNDITWMIDANYAVTAGYSKANGPGQMKWSHATTWAAQLEYGGHDDWRLPTAVEAGTPSVGFGAYGELGYLFYTNLGNDRYTRVRNNSIVGGDGATIIFTNIQDGGYWTSNADATYSKMKYTFNMSNGSADKISKKAARWAWAVRDGDVTPPADENYVQLGGETITFGGVEVVF